MLTLRDPQARTLVLIHLLSIIPSDFKEFKHVLP